MKQSETLLKQSTVPRGTRPVFRVYWVHDGIRYPVCTPRETEGEAIWDHYAMCMKHPDADYQICAALDWVQ